MAKLNKSALLKVSLASDVQHSGGKLSITGLDTVRVSRILDIKQIKYKAEVVQVVKIGYSGYTPTADTTYQFTVETVEQRREGFVAVKRHYSYHTPVVITTLGATAALQREAISAALVTKVNADQVNGRVYTTALSLGTGTGLTLTDAAGYYAVNGSRKGASTVILITNSDGSGWVNANAENTVTTAAVYSFGEGQKLLDAQPILDSSLGGLVSGNFEAPRTPGAAGTYAVAGQKYDGFQVSSLKISPAHAVTDQYAYEAQEQIIYVDNGTGTATTNLAGFVAFEREMLRAIFSLYQGDPSTIVDFFDASLVASATYPTTGAAITTTDNVVMEVASDRGTQWYVNPIGTHTLITPLVTTAGLTPYLDVTTQEGIELSPPNLTQNPKEFVVGKSEASFYAKVTFGAIATTDWKSLSVGFRKKAAYAVDQTAYEAASVATAALGVPLDTGAAPVINIITGPGSAGALTNTSAVVSPTAASTHELLVTVDINGVTKFYVNGADKTSLLAATYTFTAGLHLMPFISFRHGANVSAAPAIVQTAFIPSINWRG